MYRMDKYSMEMLRCMVSTGPNMGWHMNKPLELHSTGLVQVLVLLKLLTKFRKESQPEIQIQQESNVCIAD